MLANVYNEGVPCGDFATRILSCFAWVQRWKIMRFSFSISVPTRQCFLYNEILNSQAGCWMALKGNSYRKTQRVTHLQSSHSRPLVMACYHHLLNTGPAPRTNSAPITSKLFQACTEQQMQRGFNPLTSSSLLKYA